jgi:hypothetical protein
VFSCPKIAGGDRHHNFSKLLEIKGYEVFRVDRSMPAPHIFTGPGSSKRNPATRHRNRHSNYRNKTS